ncbi:unnamed protein product [Adineta ricciae]|uniref:BED-type domain-containing protein n=1 Tax=Adineta ricciae TaxID=249248 RepID=A0A815T8V6_ADIRI|nr:unnamed protein product [Adineta ricciae]CAF1571447.1 unnamed protein product [Adineta ricciae]
MSCKTIAKKHPRKGSQNGNTTQKFIHQFESVLNEDMVTITNSTQSTSSASSTRNKRTIMESMNETSNQDESADSMEESTDVDSRKSEVWRYAEKLPGGKAKCNSCELIISCKDHNTTGIRRHLSRCLNLSQFISVKSNFRQIDQS